MLVLLRAERLLLKTAAGFLFRKNNFRSHFEMTCPGGAMRILITGGTGFVGQHLSQFFLDRGNRVTAVGPRPGRNPIDHRQFDYIPADTTRKGPWCDTLKDTDVLINLAGKTIFKRWTPTYKQKIYDSRIVTTRNLVEALPENTDLVFCSASATGFYGSADERMLCEDASPGDDFLAEVGQDWEKEAFRAREKGARVVTMRFGIVLGRNGGILAKMVPAFRFRVGGPLGNGRQWFPWIHMRDLAAAFMFAIETPDLDGPLNCCSPNPVRNREFADALGRALRKPAFMPAPGFLIRLALGELGSALLCSQRVIPKKLLAHGFQFQYPDIDAAVADLV